MSTSAYWSDGAAGPLLHDVIAALADPLAETQWQDLALCAETDPEAFFPEKGGNSRPAKAVCMACAVRAECLDYALENDIRFGIWGGLSERQRRGLSLRRTQAAPAARTGKRCRSCRVFLPLVSFHRNRRNADGHDVQCKDCASISGKARRAA